MKLTVHRSQAADSKGVIRFSAKFRLDTSSEESDQINIYVPKDMVLGRVQPICAGANAKAYLSDLVTYQSDSIINMLAVEQKVREDIDQLSALIGAASTYDGIEELLSTE
jgi:hypothetical protein